MVNDTYSDIISNAGSIYKYTIYLHNPHFTAPVRSPVRTPRFSSQNNLTTKFYIARADSAPPTTPHAPMSLTDSPGPSVAARRRGSNFHLAPTGDLRFRNLVPTGGSGGTCLHQWGRNSSRRGVKPPVS